MASNLSPVTPSSPSTTLKNALRRNKRSKTNLHESSSPIASGRSSTASLDGLGTNNSTTSITSVTKEKVSSIFRSKRKGGTPNFGSPGPSSESLEIYKTTSAEVSRDGSGDEGGESGSDRSFLKSKRGNLTSITAPSRSSTLPIGSLDAGSDSSLNERARPATSGAAQKTGGDGPSKRTARGGSLGAGTSLPPIATDLTAPNTTVTPPTPTDSTSSGANSRRARSGSMSNTPSKLSMSVTAPLTPTSENAGTPGVTPRGPTTAVSETHAQGASTPPTNAAGNNGQQQGGFFSSILGVAQNAAANITTLANTAIKPNPNQRDRSDSGTGVLTEKEEEELRERDQEMQNNGDGANEREAKKPAVETLGMGELSLGTFISNSPENGSSGDMENGKTNTRPTSVSEKMLQGTPPKPSLIDSLPSTGTPTAASDGVHRSGSIKSLSRVQAKDQTSRQRNGSAASQALSQISQSGTLSPSQTSIAKPTGFAVASKKRNRDFHTLFRSVPESDFLIEDYGAALQREILLQGRFYVSEGHICFYSNIFGWVTTLVISFDEVVAVEKKSTALVFPNAIVVQTLHARHVFASFINRDATFEVVVGIWRVRHPALVMGVNGVSLDKDAEENAQQVSEAGEDEGDSESSTEEYDEDEDDEMGSDGDSVDGYRDALDGSGSGAGDSLPKAKSAPVLVDAAGATGAAAASAAPIDFPGPPTHAPTSCSDSAQHYDRELCDETLPVPLGRLYSLLFGANSEPFIRSLLESEKCFDISLPAAEFPDTDASGKKTRTMTYIKPLNNSIGPKQTKCICTEVLESFDLESSVTVIVNTQTPDVPSGNAFVVKTRYCMMWAPGNATRLVMNCTVEWTGKSWLKNPIEKGANDGQIAYTKELLAALRKEIAPAAVGAKGGKKKKGKKRAGSDTASVGAVASTKGPSNTEPKPAEGVMGQIMSIFGPLAESPLLPWALIILLLLLLLRQRYISSPSTSAHQPTHPRDWGQMYRGEEEELWRWIEGRVGNAGGDNGLGMKGREIKEAIDVMEGRLDALRRAVGEGR